jgi:hypothetical protein
VSCLPTVSGRKIVMTLDDIAARLPGYASGPHSDTATTSAARIAAEAARVLGHATRGGAGGLTEPATIYAVLGELAALAHRLPQVCGQLSDWLLHEHVAGRLACDSGDPAAANAEHAVFRLRKAAARAGELGAALAAAQAAAGHLKRPDRGERP